MNPRYRILPTPAAPKQAIVADLRSCATANLADASPQVQVAHGLERRSLNAGTLCGPALTVRVAAGDNLLVQHALDLARPGDVIVVDAGGYVERALVGEIMSRWAHVRGIAGFVIDGAVRDLDHVNRGPLPVYSRGVSPRGPTRSGLGEVYGDVRVGGIAVRAGDLIVGDLDGVVCVPPESAESVIDICRQRVRREVETLEAMRAGTLSRSWIAEALCSQLDA